MRVTLIHFRRCSHNLRTFKIYVKIKQEIVEECRAVGAYKNEPRNFVDTFLKQIDANASSNGERQYTGEIVYQVRSALSKIN